MGDTRPAPKIGDIRPASPGADAAPSSPLPEREPGRTPTPVVAKPQVESAEGEPREVRRAAAGAAVAAAGEIAARRAR